MQHDHPFDPTYGHDLDALLTVGCPDEPADFVDFWQATYRQATSIPLNIARRQIESANPALDLYEIEYDSLDGVRIGGWMTIPRDRPIERGVVIGHGYGGREAPDLNPPGPPGAVIMPCARGFHRSARQDLPNVGGVHVLHEIETREAYIHRGCVADYWLAASALLEVVPDAAKCLHYIGGSFGGGIGAMMLPWDKRFDRAYLEVPSFGNHPLRVTMQCVGSGESVRKRYLEHPEVLEVLKYHDAAVHAKHVRIPVLCGCALFDPAVPPPGQFAVYNALGGPKELIVRQAGHFDYAACEQDNQRIRARQEEWFAL